MREKFVRFMQGRYGTDKLNSFILISAVILSLLGSLTRGYFVVFIFYGFSYGLFGYAVFRMFSRNSYKRYEESQWFLIQSNKIKWWIQKKKRRMEEGKTHRFYKCPKCSQTVRVPKGKGKISITCPKCRTEFIKRT